MRVVSCVSSLGESGLCSVLWPRRRVVHTSLERGRGCVHRRWTCSALSGFSLFFFLGPFGNIFGRERERAKKREVAGKRWMRRQESGSSRRAEAVGGCNAFRQRQRYTFSRLRKWPLAFPPLISVSRILRRCSTLSLGLPMGFDSFKKMILSHTHTRTHILRSAPSRRSAARALPIPPEAIPPTSSVSCPSRRKWPL